MKFLLHVERNQVAAKLAKFPELVLGQLATPLSRHIIGDTPWAADNGAFSRFDEPKFRRILANAKHARDRCLFVCCPDVVGAARRTLEAFHAWAPRLEGWPLAVVAQDGIEDLEIPWSLIKAIFVGGTTHWKESQAAADVVKAGLVIGKHVHVGRINTIARFRKFDELGAHTCDGSGVDRFDWMLEKIARGQRDDNGELFSWREEIAG